MKNKHIWEYQTKPKKNQFPKNSIMWKYREKQFYDALAHAAAAAYIEQHAAWAAIMPSPF